MFQILNLFALLLAGNAMASEYYKPACEYVSVEGDATYCIQGPICSGKNSYGNCPKRNDVSTKQCQPGAKSYDAGYITYDSYHGKQCKLIKDAECREVSYGVYGCTIHQKNDYRKPKHYKVKAPKKNQGKKIYEDPKAHKVKNIYEPESYDYKKGDCEGNKYERSLYSRKCEDVSVEGDATYCIRGPVCSGKNKRGNCPRKGSKSTKYSCQPGAISYDYGSIHYGKRGNRCVLVKDSECIEVQYGVYGCGFSGYH